MSRFTEALGNNIRDLRIKKGLTQEELAEKIDVTYTQIAHWENGRRMPRFNMIIRICNVLGITLEELIK